MNRIHLLAANQSREVFPEMNGGPHNQPVGLAVPAEAKAVLGQLLFLSGMTGVDPLTSHPVGKNIREQTHQALRNCETVISAASANLGSVVDVLVL
jgi:enamine deaminase RidA (YjgF/YER057c/UK114 family)